MTNKFADKVDKEVIKSVERMVGRGDSREAAKVARGMRSKATQDAVYAQFPHLRQVKT